MLEEIQKLSEEYNEKFPVLAVIIFNTSHAHLIEALRKQTYVDALDEVTGAEIGVSGRLDPREGLNYQLIRQALWE